MKRFAIVFTAVAALAVVGCKKKEEKAPETTTTTSTTTTAPAGKPVDPAAAPADPAAAPADPAAAPAAAGTTTTTTTTTEDMNTGIAECDDLVKRYTACEKLPAEQKAAFIEGAKAWKSAASAGDEGVKKSTADACKQAATSADAALKAAGC